ncbi:MAG TPA: adenylate/guanylate cyclase domain-containing protein [Vicinamibacteria bacterium]|nr:adenylate/guanylate cyclase domain-containing protein [Vicinamibacteria bacterium]
MPPSLFLKDPQALRYLAGGLAEAEELFGAPLPELPAPERDEGRDAYLVHVHSRLRMLQQRFLETQLGQIGALTLSPGDPARDYAEYEAALVRVVRSVRQVDRRQGLLNLFWLAHSKDAAEHLRGLELRSQSLRRGKQSLFPLLQSFYRRIDQECRRPRDEEGALAWGENPSLVLSVIDDGFAFTETTAGEIDLGHFLASNKRYRIPPEAFFEIQQTLVREAERRLREGDRGLLARVGRHLPLLPRELYLKPGSLLRIVLSGPVQAYLLGDPWSTGSRLVASPAVKAEAERRRGPEILDAFLDLSVALRRFEIVSYLRERVESLGAERSLELEEKTRMGLRVYEFGESAQVLNNAVAATVLFLDLRGFTRTSEGHISERDLTQELYGVFDDFVPIVERFGGRVDKYLGDGMMVTWGTGRADPLDPLNALRTAILCQDSLRRKREAGQTWFKMGVAIHHGRVYLARFVAGRGELHSTVIGRHVNLAGRLSSAAKRPIEEDEGAYGALVEALPVAGRGVSVDADGALFNEGIALSRDAVVQLEAHLAVVRNDEGVVEYDDEAIDRRILIRYAGDAKFKGVRSSLPVYEADDVART